MENKRQFALGVFFLVALSILAFYTLFLTDFTLFRDVETEEVYFPAANGLREGDPVMISGLRIGRVKTLEYDVNQPEHKRIKATLTLNDPVEFNEGFRISIKESTLLGGRQIDIDPGTYGGAPVDRIQMPELFGTVEKNPIAALGEFGDILAENRDMVRNIVSNLDQMVSDARAGQSVIGRLLSDDEMGTDLALTFANFRGVTDDIRAGRGVLGQLVSDEELAASVKSTVDSLSIIAADLQAGKGLAGRLVYDDDLANAASEAIDNLSAFTADLRSGEGVAAKLFQDKELAAEFESAISGFRSASEDLSVVAAQVRAGEGSLGKLVMDTELYQEALESVQLITRTLEDYREAAPISTFTNVLFGAF